jgi:hypothetical protein
MAVFMVVETLWIVAKMVLQNGDDEGSGDNEGSAAKEAKVDLMGVYNGNEKCQWETSLCSSSLNGTNDGDLTCSSTNNTSTKVVSRREECCIYQEFDTSTRCHLSSKVKRPHKPFSLWIHNKIYLHIPRLHPWAY